jgi:hypothetical protein
MTTPIPKHHGDNLITRRSVFIGAAAFLICAPAIVRATSVMPVRSLILPSERPFQLNPLGEFYRRCFYHNLDFDLRNGRSMSTIENGKIITVCDQYVSFGHVPRVPNNGIVSFDTIGAKSFWITCAPALLVSTGS